MRIALARWRAETDVDGVTTFTPDIDTAELDSWGAIDLRGSGKDYQESADGLCLVVAPTLDTAIPGALIDLGDDHQTRLGTTVGRALANRLGLNLVEATPGRIAAELLTLHARADDDSKPNPLVGERRFPRSKTDQRRRARVWCAGVLLYDELGGMVDAEAAYYAETWPTVSAITSGQDLAWGIVSGSINVQAFSGVNAAAGQVAGPNPSQARTQVGVGSSDMYATASVYKDVNSSGYVVAAMARMSSGASTGYSAGFTVGTTFAVSAIASASSRTVIASATVSYTLGDIVDATITTDGSTISGSSTALSANPSTTNSTYTTGDRGGFLTTDLSTPAGATRVYSFAMGQIGEGPGGGGDDATAEPSAISTAVTFPSPTVDIVSDATPTPAVISSAVTFPSPTPSTSESAAPSAITSTTTIPSPSLAATATAAPSVVASTVTVPTPDLSGSAEVDPSAISTAVTLSTPSVDVSADADIAPSAISGAVSFPEVAVVTSGLATPTAISSTVTVPAPDVEVIMAGTAAPNPIVSSSSMPSGSIHTTATAAPAVIASTVTVPTPTPAQDATVTPDRITSSVSVGDPGIETATVVQPLPIRSDVAVNNPFATSVSADDEHTQLPWRNRTGGSNRTRTPWTREFRNR